VAGRARGGGMGTGSAFVWGLVMKCPGFQTRIWTFQFFFWEGSYFFPETADVRFQFFFWEGSFRSSLQRMKGNHHPDGRFGMFFVDKYWMRIG
jgi:hypothetical protein